MPNTHLPVTQAGVVAALTMIVGFLVAFVPNLATYQAEIISIGTAVIGVVFLIVNEIRAHTHAKVNIATINASAPVTPPAV